MPPKSSKKPVTKKVKKSTVKKPVTKKVKKSTVKKPTKTVKKSIKKKKKTVTFAKSTRFTPTKKKVKFGSSRKCIGCHENKNPGDFAKRQYGCGHNDTCKLCFKQWPVERGCPSCRAGRNSDEIGRRSRSNSSGSLSPADIRAFVMGLTDARRAREEHGIPQPAQRGYWEDPPSTSSTRPLSRSTSSTRPLSRKSTSSTQLVPSSSSSSTQPLSRRSTSSTRTQSRSRSRDRQGPPARYANISPPMMRRSSYRN